ncbi:MAG: heat-inducible transcriptional repressor HrcA [Gammaproteobacteria bacterium]|nr:heat-inducible transcriptional repressor HrcA [Gammaproteobacteria bacterium]
MSSLSARAEILLKTLVNRYVSDGQPVGSGVLARQSGLEVSPATVRNVMADLEQLGLVVSPHTSAGRIPTQKGYRVFVDSLLKIQPLSSETVNALRGEIGHCSDAQRMLSTATDMLSQLSSMASLVTLPRNPDRHGFKQIEFVGLSGTRVLVILVSQSGAVQNRVIHTDRGYSPSELVEAANYFNETYAGQTLEQVKQALAAEMKLDSETMAQAMRRAVTMAQQVFADADDAENLVVRGESNLMEFPDLGDMRQMRHLFNAFNTKRDLLHLLDRSDRETGVKIFIGNESGYQPLEQCSVVTSPYKVGNEIVGMLAVVGPTRMAYEKVIPLVDITARLLGTALSADND